MTITAPNYFTTPREKNIKVVEDENHTLNSRDEIIRAIALSQDFTLTLPIYPGDSKVITLLVDGPRKITIDSFTPSDFSHEFYAGFYQFQILNNDTFKLLFSDVFEPITMIADVENLISNGNFENWTGDNPDQWSVTETPPNGDVTQNGNACRIVSTDGTFAGISQAKLTSGLRFFYEVGVSIISGSLTVAGSSDFATISAIGVHNGIFTSDGTSYILKRQGIMDATIDYTIVTEVVSFDLTVPDGSEFYVDWGDGDVTTHAGTGSAQTIEHGYSSEGSYSVTIWGLDIKMIETFQSNSVQLETSLENFKDKVNLEKLFLSVSSAYGESSDLSKLVNSLQFSLQGIDFSGDIRQLSNLTKLTLLYAYRTNLSGDIKSISSLVNLTDLRLYETLITGDVKALNKLTSATTIYIHSTSISGDISEISNLTQINNLYLDNTNVSGDVGDLATLVNLSFLRLNVTSVVYTSTTLPAWSDADIRLQDNGWTSTEVDNFLIDLAAAGGTNGNLNIAGTNAARTTASDAAVSTLTTNGWTVTVNE